MYYSYPKDVTKDVHFPKNSLCLKLHFPVDIPTQSHNKIFAFC